MLPMRSTIRRENFTKNSKNEAIESYQSNPTVSDENFLCVCVAIEVEISFDLYRASLEALRLGRSPNT